MLFEYDRRAAKPPGSTQNREVVVTGAFS